ncbi:MAG: hypothetical protein R6U55_14355 [Desulfovermiculus sp.]
MLFKMKMGGEDVLDSQAVFIDKVLDTAFVRPRINDRRFFGFRTG